MATKKVRDLAGSEHLNLLMQGSDQAGWSFTQQLPPQTPLYAHGTVSATGGTAIAAAGAGTAIVLDKVTLQRTGGSAVLAKLRNGTASNASVLEAVHCENTGNGLAMAYPPDVRPTTDANTPVIVDLSASVAVIYTIIYHTKAL